MEKMFEHILDKDEQIVKVFKPNKTKQYFGAFITFMLSTFWFLVPLIVGIATGETKIEFDNQPMPVWATVLITTGIAILIYAIIWAVIWILVRVYYKNLYFAYSNKRVIIRTGIFGIDFKSLDMKMIGAVNVYVSLLDKILRKNTGTITFGSMASPMMGSAGNGYGYKFSHITMPYEVYKEVKNTIDEYKSK